MLPLRILRRIISEGGCLVWSGALSHDGYPQTRWRVNDLWKMRYVHRIVWEDAFGSIPGDLQVDHLCFNRKCVKLEHLELTTPQENSIRAKSPITHCPNGHEYTLENTRIRTLKNRSGTARQCRTCDVLSRQRTRLALVERGTQNSVG